MGFASGGFSKGISFASGGGPPMGMDFNFGGRVGLHSVSGAFSEDIDFASGGFSEGMDFADLFK